MNTNRSGTHRPTAGQITTSKPPKALVIAGSISPSAVGVATSDPSTSFVSLVHANLDLYPLFRRRTPKLIFTDGIHPNDAGYKVMADAVIAALNNR